MIIKQITNENFKDKWNDFVIKNSSPAVFLQSWEWGDFRQKKLKEKIFRFAIYESDKLLSVALFIKRALPNKNFYLTCPKGPIFNKQQTATDQQQVLNLLISEIKKIVKQEKIIFFRIAPPYSKNFQFSIFNFQFPKILTNLKEPENSLILDLSKSEQEILKSMRQKTRYNIRLAKKKEVIIKKYKISGHEIDRNIDIFYDLIKKTAKRDKINIFSKNYYKNLLQITSDKLRITLFIAEYKNLKLASIIVAGFGDTATYFYGASSDKKRNLMPNYLIQWEAIKWAKEKGYKFYDFWGVAKSQDKPNSWLGIDKFKRGFVNEETGKEINYMGTYDFVINKFWYNLYKIGKYIF